MSHWSAPFVGIPYLDKGRSAAGVDCWGACWLVHTVHLCHPDFPSYADRYVSGDEHAEISAIVAGEAELPIWQRIEGRPQPYDILFFRRGRWDSHAALAVDAQWMLHTSAAAGQTVIERFDTGRKPSVYRYAGGRR